VSEIKFDCNGNLDPSDVKVTKAARDGQEALARTLVSNWQSTEDGLDLLLARDRQVGQGSRHFPEADGDG
jgi:hypothetical protein